MASFLLYHQSLSDTAAWPISLATDATPLLYSGNGFQLAVVDKWPDRRKLFTFADGTAWLDGQLLVEPMANQPFTQWLENADGSFRGVFFAHDSEDVLLIADPYGSRPIYYSVRADAPAASDKLPSLPQLDTRFQAVRWDVFLEALALGSVTSTETSLTDVRQVPAGCTVTFPPPSSADSPLAARHYTSGADSPLAATENGNTTSKSSESIAKNRVRHHRSARGLSVPLLIRYRPKPNTPGQDCSHRWLYRDAIDLRRAVDMAVRNTWTNTEAPLLLSGGYDSRWILHIAGKGRRAVTTTVDPECREARIAKHTAELCGAHYDIALMDVQDWLTAMTESHAVAAGMYTPMSATFTHQAKQWARAGIDVLAHGFLFDTLMKGYFSFLTPHGESVSRIVPSRLLPAARSEMGARYLSDLEEHLTPEAQDRLRSRLAAKVSDMHWQTAGRYEFGFENAILGTISRQPHSLLSLSMLEHVELQSPVFHHEIWEWWRQSNPSHRHPAVAYLTAFLMDCGRCAWVRKDTGELAAKSLARALAGQHLGFLRKVKPQRRKGRKKQAVSNSKTASRRTTSTTRGLELVKQAMQSDVFQGYCRENIPYLEQGTVIEKAFLGRMLSRPVNAWGVHDKLPCFLASIGAFCRQVKEPVRPAPAGAAEARRVELGE